ncbi:type II toxin-antitoxin system prevent-host-death family antitoxin [Algiphilus sp. W345]|uniref:Type II toxin-antitoxin system prevent-host-death family antitoxin n=1 Tax=Banduia mediterranea TaxID=3075609 RepID=A0ABU2WG79_9GAMM|nr:type II toxin-antitoxin system prevent-host-death family antitoxin [Algiphilus sp. W345]MDT0496879.1 type II toxin-antitoxin system prevent-host-death family antitoxin [Algiphilus sp. W345]
MKEVRVSDLRQRLPEFLAMVVRGERLRISSRGKVIAEIGPPSKMGDTAASARAQLKNSVLRYDAPMEPSIEPDEWQMNR